MREQATKFGRPSVHQALPPAARRILETTGKVERQADAAGELQPTTAARRRHLDALTDRERRRRLEAAEREVRR